MNQNPASDEGFNRELEKLEESNQKQDNRSKVLQTKAVQNVNLYFIFQAVILLSTTTTTTVACRSWWIPFALSLLAAVTNLLSFVAVMSNVVKSREELDQSSLDLSFMKMYKITRGQVIQVLPGNLLSFDGGEIVRPKVAVWKKWKRRVTVYVFVVLFVGFSAVVMYGCQRILCHEGHRKCVELC